MRHIVTIVMMFLFAAVVFAAAPSKNQVKGKHLESGLGCADCHGSENPATDAKQDSCIGCHGDMTDSEWIIFEEKGKKREHSPHDSHESPIDCTKCHAAHKPTRLYCNNCHGFGNKVP